MRYFGVSSSSFLVARIPRGVLKKELCQSVGRSVVDIGVKKEGVGG